MKHNYINGKLPAFWHGGDYNPDQWLEDSDILQEDIRLMKMAGVNAVSLGIFAWTQLEPEEGKYQFEWLDNIINSLYENKIYTVLATPSGARPAWMSRKYPEVLRVRPDGGRNKHGQRHNHCLTSPVYRKKTKAINTKLAERYSSHPALLMWHISNEYSGECHCDLCQIAFRNWLKERYGDLDSLNNAWWSRFWSHTFTHWDEIESPSPTGECYIHGMNLDWRRFVTHQTIDFIKNEITPLKKANPDIPVTTNLFDFPGLDYFKLGKELDIVSWDCYTAWHSKADNPEFPHEEYVGPLMDYYHASRTGFTYDRIRGNAQGKPWVLMESTVSHVNWQPVCKSKKPGMHILSSLQAVAHGSDSVMYFQWRKGRGSSEKFHGAVVDHEGTENTRTFGEITELGSILQNLSKICTTGRKADVALLFDWENRWAINDYQGFLNDERRLYTETVNRHYHALWKHGLTVDIIDEDCPLEGYKIVSAPMLYMVRDGFAERITKFTENGGVFITTYHSGYVNDTDLCFQGGFPGPLKDLLGIWAEELDPLSKGEFIRISPMKNSFFKLPDTYSAVDYCELIHPRGAEVMAEYSDDWYSGRAALTCNRFGKGRAFYIASRNTGTFLDDFYSGVLSSASVASPRGLFLYDEGVNVQVRGRAEEGEKQYYFIMNFTVNEKKIQVAKPGFTDARTGKPVKGSFKLSPYGIRILEI